LPRLLELLAFDPHLAINPEILIGKLHDARWRSWPGEEQRAIEAYLAATWRAVLASYSSMRPYWDAGTGLCAIAQAADDLAAYLDHWRQDRSMVGRHHLANFVNSSTPNIVKKFRLGNVFWRDRRLQEKAEYFLIGNMKATIADPSLVLRLRPPS